MTPAAAGVVLEHRPVLALREIWPTDEAGLGIIADLHMELLDYGPMAGLGRAFVRDICYRIHMQEGVLRVLLAEIDGEPAGFVAITPHSLQFHRRGLHAHVAQAGYATLRALAADWRRVPKLLRALRVLGSRRGELATARGPLGEVVCIAVRPRFLAPRFARATGVRLSELLVRRSAECLRRAGVERMRMLVDADNRAVLLLYHLLGAHFADYQLGGEPMVEVRFDLADGRLAANASLPATWSIAASQQLRGAVGGEADWNAYWEEISDRQKVFRAEASDHVQRLRRLVQVDHRTRCLDFGCGFGFAAELLAPHVGSIAVWDAASSVRRRARLRLSHLSNIEFIDLSDPARSLPERAFDLITVHSVVQYMSTQEIADWLLAWRRMLAPSGRLVLSDLIQPETSAPRELLRYLRFSAKAGFLSDAIAGGVREIAAYSRARRVRPLTLVTPAQLEACAGGAGLRIEMLSENLSYRSSRRAAILRTVVGEGART